MDKDTTELTHYLEAPVLIQATDVPIWWKVSACKLSHNIWQLSFKPCSDYWYCPFSLTGSDGKGLPWTHGDKRELWEAFF